LLIRDNDLDLVFAAYFLGFFCGLGSVEIVIGDEQPPGQIEQCWLVVDEQNGALETTHWAYPWVANGWGVSGGGASTE
jgi:hypothetical protein